LSEENIKSLRDILIQMEDVLVMYSGGVDSTLLAYLATEQLGNHAVCVTAVSPSLPASELISAKKIAHDFSFTHVLLDSHEFDSDKYIANDMDRCYWCKKEIIAIVSGYAQLHDIPTIIDGNNIDDLKDFRPGRKAALEAGVRSPFIESNIGKEEIRNTSRSFRLPNWNSPAQACLSSRIPYGIPITETSLKQIDAAEDFIRGLGISQIRVRHHDSIARIEVDRDDFSHLLEQRSEILSAFREIGYTYITLDLDGYRLGSLNDGVLSKENHRE